MEKTVEREMGTLTFAEWQTAMDGAPERSGEDGETESACNSYVDAKSRFSKVKKALSYPSEYRTGNAHDDRERGAIRQALDYLKPCSKVLDLPCGTGRLTNLLLEAGHEVRGADVSNGMVRLARKNFEKRHKQAAENATAHNVQFNVVDVMDTPYQNGEFDAVVCNRLFHHFIESETRVAALTELRRITSEAVIVSFFNSKSFDACWRRVRNWMRMRRPKDRLPISLKQFESELNSAGLRIVARIPARPFISQQFYIVARPRSISQ
ncbi:MAG: methyltransferase domain-containing protein [Kiritimatiellaeota bacterium]|nr:methyltransferase domain-containing protein [Kiritimatiellota bacterium]